MPAYEIEVDMARLSALRRGAEMVSMPDPLLRLIDIPRGVRVNALVDAWCDEMNAPRAEATKGGKPIVDSEMRLYDLASFRACATERGVTLTGDPLPGDGFVFGSTSYIYDPESPDAR